MATLVLEQLDDDLVRRLEERAAAHGRSAAAEHQTILEEALRPRAHTGAELVAALHGKGPWLDDDRDERMRELDQPAEARPSQTELLAELDRIRAMTPLPPPGVEAVPGWVLIREDRDAR